MSDKKGQFIYDEKEIQFLIKKTHLPIDMILRLSRDHIFSYFGLEYILEEYFEDGKSTFNREDRIHVYLWEPRKWLVFHYSFLQETGGDMKIEKLFS